jgi:hypothetical protein
MKKIAILLLLLTFISETKAQDVSGYVVTLAKDTIRCDDINTLGFSTAVKCTTNGQKTSYKRNELFCYKMGSLTYIVFDNGKKLGNGLISNKNYVLVSSESNTSSGSNTHYFVVDMDNKVLEEMPRGKNAATILLKYFNDSEATTAVLTGYKSKSQTAVFNYKLFYEMVSNYNSAKYPKTK